MKTRKVSYLLYNEERKKSMVLDLDKFLKTWKPKKHVHNQKVTDSILTFDTETTVDYEVKDGKKYPIVGFINMGQFCLDGHLIYCRTIEEIMNFFFSIDKILKENKMSIRCYVHNLGYDYQFIKDFFNENGLIESKMLGDERSPITIKYEDFNVQLFCSLKLFGKKLEKVAKDYNLPVLKGHGWDYNKYRTTKTRLSPEEVEYGMHDVLILYYALQEKIKEGNYEYIMNVPATKTGEVRYFRKKIVGGKGKYFNSISDVKTKKTPKDYSGLTEDEFNNLEYDKNICYYRNHYVYYKIKKTHANTKTWYKRTILQFDSNYIKTGNSYIKDFDTVYKLTQKAFQGGFTHANKCMLGRVLRNVRSYDLTSAYPSVMLVKKFVYHYTYKVEGFDRIKFDKNNKIINDKYGYLMKLKFTNIRDKHGISVISHHKVEDLETKNVRKKYGCGWIDNGRILKADSFIITCYETDYNMYRDYYTWDKCELLDCYKGKKTYLLDSDRQTILHFYEAKCYWKCEKKRLENSNAPESEINDAEIKLKYAKQQLNSIYGCSAMDPWNYCDQEKTSYHEFCKQIINKRDAVSTYTIGGQVTSYVREQILTAIKMIGYKDMVYSDTDSIKFLNSDKHESVFEELNKIMRKEVDEVIEIFNIDTSKWIDDKGNEAYLNCFDDEGSYPLFKTLGAKRYIHTKMIKDKETGEKRIKLLSDEYTSKDSLERLSKHNIDLNRDYIECTTAGCPKFDMLLYIYDGSNTTTMEAFRRYNKGINVTDTDKRAPLYVDITEADKDETREIKTEEHIYVIKKHKGSKLEDITIYDSKRRHPVNVKSASHTIIYKATFSMNTLADDVEYSIGINTGEIISDIKR